MADYIFYKSSLAEQIVGVQRSSDNACIPLDVSNSDYLQFISDWNAGATVLNADGTPASLADFGST
jgi:hypothetical protein